MGWLDGFLGVQPQQDSPEVARQKRIQAREQEMKQRQDLIDARTAPRQIQQQQSTLQQVMGDAAEVVKIGMPTLGFVGGTMGRLASGSEAGTTNAYNLAHAQQRALAPGISDDERTQRTNELAQRAFAASSLTSPTSVGPQAAVIGNIGSLLQSLVSPQEVAKQEAEGYKTPWKETWKALKSDPNDPAVHGMEAAEQIGISGKGPLGGIISPAFAVGMGLDVGNDPLTYLQGGFDAGTKGAVSAETKAAELAGQVWDKPALEALGVDISNHTTDMARMAAEGSLRTEDLSQGLGQELYRKSLEQAGQDAAGQVVKHSVPFLRTVDGKIAGAEIPAIVTRSGPEYAADVAARMSVDHPTLAARIGNLTGIGLEPKVIEVGTQGFKDAVAEEAAKAAGMTAEEKAAQLASGKLAPELTRVGDLPIMQTVRSADQGGLKLFGETIFRSPELEDAAATLAHGIRQIPGVSAVEGLVNPLADVAREGNPLMTNYLKSLGRKVTVEMGVHAAAAQQTEDELTKDVGGTAERMRLGQNIGEVVDPYQRTAQELNGKMADAAAAKAAKVAAAAGVEPADVLAEAATGAAGPTVLDARMAAFQKQMPFLDKQAALEARQAAIDDVRQSILDGLPDSAGKTSYTLGRKGAFRAGEAQGTERAVTSEESAVERAAAEYDRMAERASKQGTIADALRAKNGSDLPPAASTALKAEAIPVATPAQVYPELTADEAKRVAEIKALPNLGGNAGQAELYPLEDKARMAGRPMPDEGYVYHSTPARNAPLIDESGLESAPYVHNYDDAGEYIDSGETDPGRQQIWFTDNADQSASGGPDVIYRVKKTDLPIEPTDASAGFEGGGYYAEQEQPWSVPPQNLERFNPKTKAWEPVAPAAPVTIGDQMGTLGGTPAPMQANAPAAGVDTLPLQADLSKAAGVPPEANRTPITRIASGAPRTYNSWQAALQDGLDSTAEPAEHQYDIIDAIREYSAGNGVKYMPGTYSKATSEEWQRTMGGVGDWKSPTDPYATPFDSLIGEISTDHPELGLAEKPTMDEALQAVDAAKRTRALGLTGAQDAQEFARDNGTEAADILAGRVRSALDSGDLKTAQRYQANLDDFLAWYNKPDVDPFDPTFQVSAPGNLAATGGDLDAARAAWQEQQPAVAQQIADTALTTKQQVKQAFGLGRAQGTQAQMRLTAADAVRAETAAAKAEGRVANYQALIDRAGSDAERYTTAAEVLRATEKESTSIARDQAVNAVRLRASAKPLSALQKQLGRVSDAATAAETYRTMQEAVLNGDDYVDWSRLNDRLIAQGSTPAAAANSIEVAQSQLTPMSAANMAALDDAGLTGTAAAPVEFKQGPNIPEGYGYGTAPPKPSWLSRVSGGKFGVSEREKIAADVIKAAEPGVNPAELHYPGDTSIFDPASLGFSPSRMTPKQEQAAVYATAGERESVGGLATENDIAITQAQANKRVADAVTKAKVQDEIATNIGTELAPGVSADTAHGYSLFPITRNGETVNYQVPAYVRAWYDKIDNPQFFSDESTNAIVRTFDKVQNTWKKMATTWNPAFHGRNALSHYWMAWAGDASDPASWEKFGQVYLTADKDPGRLVEIGGMKQTAAEWKAQADALGVMKHWAGPQQTTQSLVERANQRAILSTPVGIAMHPGQAMTAIGRDTGAASVDLARGGVWFASMNNGMTPEAAALNVDRILYDYAGTSLTPFERNVAKRVVPFYTFMRRNIPRMAEIAVKTPGKLTLMAHLRDNLMTAAGITDADLTDNQRSAYAMPIAGGIYSPTILPFTNFDQFGDESGGLAGSMSPIIKTPLELAANTDFTYKTPLNKWEGDKATVPGYVQKMDDMLSGNPLWEDAKQHMGMEYRRDSTTGNMVLQMGPKARYIIKQASPFLEKLSSVMSDSTSTQEAATKYLYFLTGLKAAPLDVNANRIQNNKDKLAALANKKRALQEAGKMP